MARRRRKFRISLIGAGSVGTALAVALHRSGHSIVSVVSRTVSSAHRCARLVGCRNYSANLLALSRKHDLILITVPEDAIKSMVQELWRLNIPFDRMFVAHTSGVFSNDVLRPLKTRGAVTFSLHPIQTFPKSLAIEDHVRSLKGISYGFVGERASHSFARELVHDIGGLILPVPKEAKILYHLACVFASNYSVVVLGVVEKLVRAFSNEATLKDFKELIQSSIANALSTGASRALTGPIVRGSVGTVRLHLLELRKKEKSLLPLYRTLGLMALELALKERKLPAKKVKQLRKMLKSRREKMVGVIERMKWNIRR